MRTTLKKIKGHRFIVTLIQISVWIKRNTGLETRLYKKAWEDYSRSIQRELNEQ